mmetsp:Transcript_33151/g.97801  ORF Transcript_33151/g.97801 Transcript_33151/m.97801 type:complete len:204 (-) Transcript_33151:1420-2031(-)
MASLQPQPAQVVGPGSQYRASAPLEASLAGPSARLCRDSSMPPSPPTGTASRDMATVDRSIFGPPRGASMATRLNPNGGRPDPVSRVTFEGCPISHGRYPEASTCSVRASIRLVAFGPRFQGHPRLALPLQGTTSPGTKPAGRKFTALISMLWHVYPTIDWFQERMRRCRESLRHPKLLCACCSPWTQPKREGPHLPIVPTMT